MFWLKTEMAVEAWIPQLLTEVNVAFNTYLKYLFKMHFWMSSSGHFLDQTTLLMWEAAAPSVTGVFADEVIHGCRKPWAGSEPAAGSCLLHAGWLCSQENALRLINSWIRCVRKQLTEGSFPQRYSSHFPFYVQLTITSVMRGSSLAEV